MKKTNWFVVGSIIILFLISIYYVVSTSSYVRFWADDFCSSVLLRNTGFWQVQSVWFNSWTGRYSATFFTSFVELFGLIGAKLLPIILFASIIIFGLPYSLLSVLFLFNSPNIIQTFYWMTGSLNYFAPFVLLIFFLSLLFRKSNRYLSITSFIVLFIATGFSEAFGVANLLFLVFLLLIIKKSESRRLLAIGIFSTILSLGLMSLAPGNDVRSATVTHPSGLIDLITKTFFYSKWYLIHLLYIKTFVISILSIVVGAFVFLKSNIKYFEKPKMVMLLSLGFMIGVTVAVVGLTYQAINWEPPERVMYIVNNMIIMATVIFSIGLFQIASNKVSKKVATVVFGILILILAYQVHLDWSKVKTELKNSAESTTYKAVGKLDGLEENGGWVKSCIIEYYRE